MPASSANAARQGRSPLGRRAAGGQQSPDAATRWQDLSGRALKAYQDSQAESARTGKPAMEALRRAEPVAEKAATRACTIRPALKVLDAIDDATAEFE